MHIQVNNHGFIQKKSKQSWNYKRVQHRPNQQQNCNQTAKQAATKVQNKPPKAATLHDKQPKYFKKPHQTG